MKNSDKVGQKAIVQDRVVDLRPFDDIVERRIIKLCFVRHQMVGHSMKLSFNHVTRVKNWTNTYITKLTTIHHLIVMHMLIVTTPMTSIMEALGANEMSSEMKLY